MEEWDHLQDIVLPQPEISEVGLLLGANAFLAMEPLRVIPSVNGSPYATLTRFGWVICGLNQTAGPPDVTTVCKTTVTEGESLEEMSKSSNNHKYAEHLHCTKRELSAADRLWMRKVESSVAYKGGQYNVPLHLTDDHVKLPNILYFVILVILFCTIVSCVGEERLQNADLAYNAKHRIIMLSHEKNTEMLMQDVHKRLGHAGRQHVLADVQDVMWLLERNATVRRGLSTCLFCKRRYHSSLGRLLEGMTTCTSMKNETLVTFMCKVEAIINSRPLTPVSTDHLHTEPLSPNLLLLAGAGYDLVPVNLFDKTDSNSRKRWKQAAYYADMFWKRWRAEYLPLLQARPHHLSRAKPNLGVGDIVVVVDESVPRGQWPLGRVLRVKHSADGLVRSVELQVRGTTLQRPVTKIVKLI
ncbi:uncharacterized protein LOC122368657 [Amphibalanus amphitrite]|uniref:uncharacterized protein LOC122368657 n=1 Tax=Amphibalanus amphitrite TaxID=1232801 RepID=UPI001C8FF9BD|nr:uncharacterized protein LOC122368657 [Amphibalanus amphitrite]